MHTIYHIPQSKVGCTDNLERRKTEYPEGTVFEILAELEAQTPKAAGDLEWYYVRCQNSGCTNTGTTRCQE